MVIFVGYHNKHGHFFFLSLIKAPKLTRNIHCVFRYGAHYKIPIQETKSSASTERDDWPDSQLHIASKPPHLTPAFLSSVNPSAAICGHYPDDQNSNTGRLRLY